MVIFLGFVVLVLAGAVVLLFAMLGELASRVPVPGQSGRTTQVRPVAEARLGHEPTNWPRSLAGFATADQGLILVLSTACGSCEDVAAQLSADLVNGQSTDVGVVVSTGEAARGEDFVMRHGLDRTAVHIDEFGDWLATETGVTMSPTALVFRNGRLESAFAFADLSAVKSAAIRTKEVA